MRKDKGPVMWKAFRCYDVFMCLPEAQCSHIRTRRCPRVRYPVFRSRGTMGHGVPCYNAWQCLQQEHIDYFKIAILPWQLMKFFHTMLTNAVVWMICKYFGSHIMPRHADDTPHWDRVTHICVGKLTINGSDNGLSPCRRQAIIWTQAGILLIEPLAANFSEIIFEI